MNFAHTLSFLYLCIDFSPFVDIYMMVLEEI